VQGKMLGCWALLLRKTVNFPSPFFSTIEHIDIRNVRPLGGYFFASCKIFKYIIIVTVQNRNVSFFGSQGWRILLNLLVTILLLTIYSCLERA
jgi:hypothetical protein